MTTLPSPLYSVSQVRELERLTLLEQGIESFDLMRQAGFSVFQCLQTHWPEASHIAIFCGTGNNAGDGYIAATFALQAKSHVTVYSVIDPEKLSGDALKAYQTYLQAQGVVQTFQADQPIKADIIIDALFGIGLNKPITGLIARAIYSINASGLPILAVDIPSGLNANTGDVLGCAVKANATLSFVGLKQGLFTGQAADYCGEIYYDSLNLTSNALNSVTTHISRIKKIPLAQRPAYSHKGHYGHVLVIGGDQGYSGAARLASEAALRIGAGLVSVATRKEHANLLNLGRPELMCHGIDNANQLSLLFDKADVIVVGPGLGRSTWAKELFIAAVNTGKPLVVDADGLYFIAHARIKNTHWILTPHPGEAAQLLHCSIADVEHDRFTAATAIQTRYGGITVLKGSGTLVVDHKAIGISNTGNPGMSSGGMGDVLAGVIGGLLAQNLSMQEAAQQGVYLHGLAGDKASQQHGQPGLLASDLMLYLSQVVT